MRTQDWMRDGEASDDAARSPGEAEHPPGEAGHPLDDAGHPLSLALVRAGNEEVDRLLRDETFERDVRRVTAILEDEDKLFVCRRRAGHIYDFQRSPERPHGLWRRLPATARPHAGADWEPVFDLDAHCEETGHEWAWRGVIDAPDPARAMMMLSDNGSDVLVAREFDLERCAFVPDGFSTPPARQSVRWDGPDALLVSAATGPEHAVRSGWPRTTRLWARGTRLEDAPVIHEAAHDDLFSGVSRVAGTDLRVHRTTHTIQTSSIALQRAVPGDAAGGPVRPVDLPRDADKGATDRFALFRPHLAGEHPAGSVVVRALDGVAGREGRPDAGSGPDGAPFERVLFEPTPRSAITTFLATRRWLFMTGHDRLVPWMRVLDLDAPRGPLREVDLPEGIASVSAGWHAADPDRDDDPRIQIVVEGPLSPPTLLMYDPRDGSLETVATETPVFDASGMRTELLEARSADGTMVPYRVALPREAADGPVPAVVTAYGGFGVALGAPYQRLGGATLLERGIASVTAHLRGGGEFGPDWHRAATGRNRHKAFEDCVAVARDLVGRGIAPRGGVGFTGGSNGGLLAAVMATRYPDDFGAIKADVPVADMLRFHRFEAGAAWIEEYGDPDDPKDAEHLAAYSPVHNVPPATEMRLPPVLVDAPLHDDRVDPAHARAFARAMMDAGHEVMLRTAETGGHGGGETSRRQAEDAAMRAAFFRRALRGELRAA